MLEPIFYDIVEITIAASLVIAALIWLFPKIDKHYTVAWRKTFWLLFGICLLIPYHFSFPNTPIRLLRIQGTITQDNGGIIPLSFLIAAIWGIGVILYIRIRYLHYLKFKNDIIEQAEEVTETEIINELQKIKQELLIQKEIRVFYHKKLTTPMVTGIFKPMLLLPKKEYQKEELDLILIHECMHIDNHDIFYKVLMTFVGAVHWFNPLVHKMVLLSFRDLELVCDYCVVEDMKNVERAFYAKTILDSIATENYRDVTYSTCFYGSEKIMKQRIDTIFDTNEKKKGTFLLIAVFIFYFIMSSFISCGYKPYEEQIQGKIGGRSVCMNEGVIVKTNDVR